MSDDVTITGTDAPDIMGVGYRGARKLYEIKRGLVVDDDEPTPAMKAGTALEPMVREFYAEATGRKVYTLPERGFVQHPALPWMQCHVDFLAEDPKLGLGVGEIKCPGMHVFGKVLRQGVLDSHQVQSQHNAEVCLGLDVQWIALVVFGRERWQMVHFDVAKDSDLIRVLMEREVEFRQAVLKGEPPVDTGPVLELPHETGPVIQVESAVWASAARDFILAQQMLDEANALHEHAKERIVRVLAEAGADAGEGAGLRVYYRSQAGRVTLDKAALKRDGVDLAKYERSGNPFKVFKGYPLKGQRDE